MKFRVMCAECGGEFEAQRRHAEFCSTGCRRKFNNRRAQRGAELYDFIMLSRFGDAQNGTKSRDYGEECRDIVQSLASGYRQADVAYREGRRSYSTLRAAKAQLIRLPGTDDGR